MQRFKLLTFLISTHCRCCYFIFLENKIHKSVDRHHQRSNNNLNNIVHKLAIFKPLTRRLLSVSICSETDIPGAALMSSVATCLATEPRTLKKKFILGATEDEASWLTPVRLGERRVWLCVRASPRAQPLHASAHYFSEWRWGGGLGWGV